MANKNFKVKTGLDLPAPLPVEMGGTGQTTTSNTLNAILPIQTDNNGKYLSTDGTSTAWSSVPTPLAQISEPSSPTDGLIWVDTDGFAAGQQVIRWYQLPASGTTVLSGLDQNSLPLSYTPGYELVFINGTLISRYSDYTATDGSTVTLSTATNTGDIIEIFGTQSIATADVYTQTQADSRYMLNTNSPVAGKNKLINGDFSIAQRGTSISTSSSLYTLDRWAASPYGGSTHFTVSQQTSLPPTNSRHYLQVVHGSTSYTNMFITQSLETTDVIKLQGKTVTLSFQYKVPVNFTNQWSANAWWGTSIDTAITNSGTGTSIFQTSLPNVDGWTTSSTTFVVPSTATQLSIMFVSLNNVISGATFQLATVQLEIGSIATDFQTATGTIQGELAACQRYYWRNAGGGLESCYGYGVATGTGAAELVINNPVPMRVVATSVESASLALLLAGVAFYGASSVALKTSASSINTSTITLSASGLTTSRMYALANNGSVNTGYIAFSAEL
jgi:hypothetical protein